MNLNELIKKGGVYYSLEGESPKEALDSLICALPPQKNISPVSLLQAVMEREALMSTSIGGGIAIPHPRNPLIDDPEGQFAALGFLKNPLDWNALDRKPVDVLLLIVTSSAKLHLQILSRITYFSREGDFRKLLGSRAPAEQIIKFIKDAEEEWK